MIFNIFLLVFYFAAAKIHRHLHFGFWRVLGILLWKKAGSMRIRIRNTGYRRNLKCRFSSFTYFIIMLSASCWGLAICWCGLVSSDIWDFSRYRTSNVMITCILGFGTVRPHDFLKNQYRYGTVPKYVEGIGSQLLVNFSK